MDLEGYDNIGVDIMDESAPEEAKQFSLAPKAPHLGADQPAPLEWSTQGGPLVTPSVAGETSQLGLQMVSNHQNPKV